MESPLPDVIAVLRSLVRQDIEGMRLVFAEYGFTDPKAAGFVGRLCGLFIGQAMFGLDGRPDVDGLLDRLYEVALSES
jgi:hypothetical protein